MGVGDRVAAVERRRQRHLQGFGEGAERPAGGGRAHAAAGDDHRAPGPGDALDRGPHPVGVRGSRRGR